MANKNTTFRVKRSATPSAAPSAGSLDLGEIAVNTYDGKMYIKKNNGTDSIVEIGANGTAGIAPNYKAAVYTATSTAGTLATSFANGQTISGITLTTGMRILIKDQTDVTENGIYTVNASGAPTLADDFNSTLTRTTCIVSVSAGSGLAGTLWAMSGNVVVGGTSVYFNQVGGSGSSGTVTSTSVVSANGFAGTVATATTTPAITISTSVTGLLKGNGTAISAATAGTDFLTPTGSAASLTSFPTLNQNTTGTASNVTGIVAVAKGGTGLTAVGTSGNVLTSDGTNWTSTAPSGGGGSSSNTYKEAVRAATTANIAFTGNVVMDGLTTAAGDRILVKNQSTASQNGIYIASTSAWTRATDFDTTGPEVANGAIIPVQFGTVNGGSTWQLTTNGGAIGNSFVFAPISTAATSVTSIIMPTASGSNSAAFGSGAQSRGINGLAIRGISGPAGNHIAIGGDTYSSGSNPANQIMIGAGNLANSSNAADAIVIGNGTIAFTGGTGDGAYCIAIGSSSRVGDTGYTNNIAASIAMGRQALANMSGMFSLGIGGQFSTSGDKQIAFLAYHATSTAGTAVEIGASADGNATTTPTARIILSNDTSYIFDCDIIARNTATDTESKAWNLKFAIRRGTNAASTALIGTATTTIIGEDTGTSAWAVAVTADTTNGRPNISVTGEASKTIRWVANIRMTKVTG